MASIVRMRIIKALPTAFPSIVNVSRHVKCTSSTANVADCGSIGQCPVTDNTNYTLKSRLESNYGETFNSGGISSNLGFDSLVLKLQDQIALLISDSISLSHDTIALYDNVQVHRASIYEGPVFCNYQMNCQNYATEDISMKIHTNSHFRYLRLCLIDKVTKLQRITETVNASIIGALGSSNYTEEQRDYFSIVLPQLGDFKCRLSISRELLVVIGEMLERSLRDFTAFTMERWKCSACLQSSFDSLQKQVSALMSKLELCYGPLVEEFQVPAKDDVKDDIVEEVVDTKSDGKEMTDVKDDEITRLNNEVKANSIICETILANIKAKDDVIKAREEAIARLKADNEDLCSEIRNLRNQVRTTKRIARCLKLRKVVYGRN